ncbi:MAG: molybdopterin converting factor subunit 1 [Desulfobacteraceae bacterium]|nr:molybdopterin converting factor subunit 1 [Desulfobacteraceae bacterium]
MRGTIKLFALLREAVGRSEIEWELVDGAKVESLIAHLKDTLPGFDEWADRAWIAVNQSYATSQTLLQEGDEVALFPPVSGG